MNVLLSFAGSVLYFVFMFFFMPILVLLYALLLCWHTYILLHHLSRNVQKLAVHLHITRKSIPERRTLARRLATVHA